MISSEESLGTEWEDARECGWTVYTDREAVHTCQVCMGVGLSGGHRRQGQERL